jgi:hypothetical protein
MGRAFVVVLGGLLATMAGIRTGPETRSRPHLTGEIRSGEGTRHEL